MSQSEKKQARKIMRALDKNIQYNIQFDTASTEVTIHKLKHSYKKVGSLTSHNIDDTGFIIYHFIQQFILNKRVYPTLDLPFIRKQVAIQLALDRYTEFIPIY